MKCSLGMYNFLEEISAAAAKLLQLCSTLCDPIDGSPPGSPVPRILQARTLEWVALSFSNAWKWKVKVSHSVMSDSWRPHGLQPTRLLCPWDFPGKSTGVGCHCLLQGVSYPLLFEFVFPESNIFFLLGILPCLDGMHPLAASWEKVLEVLPSSFIPFFFI